MPRSTLPTFDEAARALAERLVWAVVGAALGAAVYALVAWEVLDSVPLTRWLAWSMGGGALLGAVVGGAFIGGLWRLITEWW